MKCIVHIEARLAGPVVRTCEVATIARREGLSGSHQWAHVVMLLARHEYGSAGHVPTVACTSSHSEMVDKHPGVAALTRSVHAAICRQVTIWLFGSITD